MLIKLLDGGKLPTRQTAGAAGYDCYARDGHVIRHGHTAIIPLGFAVQVPDGMEMQIRGRSGLSKRGILVHLGTIDSDYRGEVGAIITNLSGDQFDIFYGDRVCQAVFARALTPQLHITDNLPETERGTQGYGSTGVS